MVKAISNYIKFCYFARLDVHTEATLKEMEKTLAQFHQYREIFRQTGVRPDGFDSLPRQHSLKHQTTHIRNFGALNGLCTSIMESKHIKAVKEPWRRSSRYEALGQMLLTNQRLDKLAAARVDFTARGMLKGSGVSYVIGQLDEQASSGSREQSSHGNVTISATNEGPNDDSEDDSNSDRDRNGDEGDAEGDDEGDDEEDGGAIDGTRDHVDAVVKLAKTPGMSSL